MAMCSKLSETDLTNGLLRLESPFTWTIPSQNKPIEYFIKQQTEKFDNVEEFEFQWTSYILHILLAYELCDKLEDFAGAEEHIRTCEDHLDSLKEQNCREMFLVSIQTALWHVLLATKAHVLLKKGDTVGLCQMIAKIKPLGQMKPADKAGILGIKAAVYNQYGTEGSRLALEFAKESRDLDPDQAEWHFLVGSAMGRLRRTYYSRITPEEVTALEKAFTLQKNATYTVYLGQIYAEYARELFYYPNRSRWEEDIEKSKVYSKKAVDRFKEAIELRPNCASLMARVAHGLIRIRDEDVLDIPYAKELLDRAVQMAPSNVMIHHDLGLYYEKFENNTEKAIASLKKSSELGNIRALVYMAVLKWKHGMRQEIIGDLKGGLAQHTTPESQAELLTMLGAAHILIEDDWTSGVGCWIRSLEVDPSAPYLQRYQGFKGKDANLLQLVANELRLKTADSSADHVTFQRFLVLTRKLKPEIFNTKPIPGEFDNWKGEQLTAQFKKRRK